ncbi:hypothetical protein GCM10011375_07920 [Hymenobacter qilianensis]|uniref:Uncharacterized protein n=2 Tax=Hymenobacter qilianensis TaxID=1385715 RepID=A0ACB5PN17_9BACT|nr:energy transducer TonB [Hymenobacter qilianensis]GGF55010.1 hypothetical protein GCM10011375_07920 [Hymenobacter qilianensis]
MAQGSTSTKPILESQYNECTKAYTYVENMPTYLGGNTKNLISDLAREFQVASTKAGCSPPSPVFVRFTVDSNGAICNVASVNNSENTPHPKLSAACEAALVAAANKLPRFKPGMQNGRRVAVSYTLKLASAQ